MQGDGAEATPHFNPRDEPRPAFGYDPHADDVDDDDLPVRVGRRPRFGYTPR